MVFAKLFGTLVRNSCLVANRSAHVRRELSRRWGLAPARLQSRRLSIEINAARLPSVYQLPCERGRAMNGCRIFIALIMPAILAGSLPADQPPAAKIVGLRRLDETVARLGGNGDNWH